MVTLADEMRTLALAARKERDTVALQQARSWKKELVDLIGQAAAHGELACKTTISPRTTTCVVEKVVALLKDEGFVTEIFATELRISWQGDEAQSSP